MATSDERLERLTIAGLVLNFEYGLRSTGKASIGWGIFSIVIGAAVTRINVPAGAISIVLGVLLIGVGIYEMRARKPKAMVVSSVTLGLLALWNLGLAALAYFLGHRVHGQSIIAGLLQAYGAYTTWTSYHVYAGLRELLDAAALQETGELVRQLSTTEDGFVKFRVRPATDEEQFWRIKFVGDLALLVRLGGTFGRESSKRLNVREVVWVRAADIRVEPHGEAWIGKEVKATIHIGEAKIEKAMVSPDMLQRLEMRV